MAHFHPVVAAAGKPQGDPPPVHGPAEVAVARRNSEAISIGSVAIARFPRPIFADDFRRGKREIVEEFLG